MPIKKSNTKLIIIISAIILTFIVLAFSMFYFYNRYVENLNLSNNQNEINTNNLSLLPSFTESSDSGVESVKNVELDTGTVLDNLNKIRDYKSDEEALKGAKLQELESKSVLDYVLAQKRTSSTTEPQFVIRYFRENDGVVIDYNIGEKKKLILNLQKYENIKEAKFSVNGEYLITRNYDGKNIQSKLTLVQTNTVYELEQNITSFDFFQNNNIVYGITKNDGVLIKIYDIKTNKTIELATIPLTQWNIEVTSEQNIRMTNKASGESEGISLIINTKTKKIQNEIKPINGLAIKETEGGKYLMMTEGGLGFNNLLFYNKKSQNIFSLEENTFIEKCAKNILKDGIICSVPNSLEKQSIYPDTYYKIGTNASEKIVFKSLTSTSSKLIYSFLDLTFTADDLKLTNYGFYFRNAKTRGLYTLQ